jgi:hypothetical protein
MCWWKGNKEAIQPKPFELKVLLDKDFCKKTFAFMFSILLVKLIGLDFVNGVYVGVEKKQVKTVTARNLVPFFFAVLILLNLNGQTMNSSPFMVYLTRFAVKKIQIPWNIMWIHLICTKTPCCFVHKLQGASRFQLKDKRESFVFSSPSIFPSQVGNLWLLWLISDVKHFENCFVTTLMCQWLRHSVNQW